MVVRECEIAESKEDIQWGDLSVQQRQLIQLARQHLSEITEHFPTKGKPKITGYRGVGNRSAVMIIQLNTPDDRYLSSMRNALGSRMWQEDSVLQPPYPFDAPMGAGMQLMPVVQFMPSDGENVYVGFLSPAVNGNIKEFSF